MSEEQTIAKVIQIVTALLDPAKVEEGGDNEPDLEKMVADVQKEVPEATREQIINVFSKLFMQAGLLNGMSFEGEGDDWDGEGDEGGLNFFDAENPFGFSGTLFQFGQPL